MERKGLRKRDILRMDGLLPPTRRLPVCDAVSSTPDKKKDRKWSIGGILRRISSIRDYDSSSNDEEIVYKEVPRKSAKVNRQSDGVVLHSLENNPEQRVRIENNVRQSADSPHSYRDSLHSRSSDGSLDGLGKKSRRNKLKARAEAKRDHLCVDSSSDEDCRRSNGSLNRFHGCGETQNGQRSSNACNSRKTRAARTERYIKRLSRDDGNGSGDTLNDSHHKRCPTEYITEDEERAVHADNGLCRPPVHPRRFVGSYSTTNNRGFPVPKSFVENLRDAVNPHAACLPEPEIYGDFRRYSTGQCVTDLNRNTYGKISRSAGKTACADNYGAGNFFTYPAKHSWHHSESYDCVADRRPIDTNNRPPEPPPRDPRYRVFNYGYSSYPARKQQQYTPNSLKQHDDATDTANGMSILDGRNFRSYGSNNEIAWRNATERENSTPNAKTDFRNSLERINNQYNSSRHGANNAEEEATRCQRRNTRNNQLNCGNDGNYSAYTTKNKSTNIRKSNKQCETISTHALAAASSDWPPGRSPCEQRVARSVTPTTCTERIKKAEDARRMTPSEEALERRRSSKNLEEALSELEAIYNSLRLGDEDLLDRAERRSMEEFSLKQSKSELTAAMTAPDDSPDRTKDDMAYRRMHPKERPTSLSDIAGQSALSNISYLIASPILSRRDSADDLTRLSSAYPSRRNEPDVTRDDVVFRSISHANNTLRVIDPQPPFGIPLGPVTAATESDYLHTTPSKPEQPRSSYIPQCEPDVVTDDLAYRTLRKDAGAARSPTESGRINVAIKEQPANVTRKKRAVRSLSANLYGLINHDRIHLRREPSLDAIKDEIQDATRNEFAATSSERPKEYLRRVVSDGELSDTDARRRKEPALGRDTDINGNHPVVGAYRGKPCVYTLLETTEATRRRSPKKEKAAPSAAESSDAVPSSKTVLDDDDFWHEYLRSDSNISAANSGTAETDFSAYSRLCQDLVNLIKSDEDTAPPIESPNAVDSVAPADKSDDFDVKREVDEPATSIRSRDSRCSESRRAARASDELRVADENVESPIPSSNSTEPISESSQPAGNLDFYLRVADENVKLIAEAFGSVADRLRDSRLSVLKNNSSSGSHGSEAETHSARSSALCSQDDEHTNDEQRLAVPPRPEETVTREKRNSTTSNEGDQSGSRCEDVSTADAELDLSTAVRNLQLAAASLCEHEPEIESLRVRRAGRIDVTPAVTSTDENEDDSPMRKIGLIADALRQEQERDQEEAVVPPSSVETRSDATLSEGKREGYQAFARSQ